MRASINIQLEDVGAEELHRFLAALQGSTATAKVSGLVEGATVAPDTAAPVVQQEPEQDAPPPTPEADTPPACTKAKRGRPPKAKTPGATSSDPVADAAAAAEESEAAPAKAAAPAVSDNAVKAAVAAAIKAHGVEKVRAVVMSFKDKDGGQATNLSKLQPQDFADVLDALKALEAGVE